ncbi:MAG: GAF domain-containing sensor histidine kinase [Ktedonobacterales bacterium]|nr:GAF domain-containing sensor histidine kinase [Ktedonobacterales bacterium]
MGSEAEQLRRRNQELSILNAIAEALNRSVEIEEALGATLARVAELLGLRTGWVWLLREGSGRSYLAASLNLPPALVNNPRRMEGWCYCLDTFRTGDLAGAANVNVVTCTRLKDLVDDTDGLRYHASIPLYAQSQKLGVLNVASPEWRELSPDDLQLLHTVGDLLSIAIQRARLFARSMQLGAVEERNRLAREIHDTLAQGMTAVALQLETVDALLEADVPVPQARAALDRALVLNRANLEEARRSVLDLRAALLEGKSLAQAIRALARDWQAPPRLTVAITGANQPLPPRIEVGIYRIVQEALTNTLRHAQATRVSIRLSIAPQMVRCSIIDDGIGFDPTLLPAGHYGLIGLNERARLLGGTLRIASLPSTGTRLTVTVPLGGRNNDSHPGR